LLIEVLIHHFHTAIMSSLADLEQQLRESEDDLQSCQEALAEDPEDASVLELVEALISQIAQLKRDIAASSAAAAAAAPPPPSQNHQLSRSAIDDSTPPPPPTNPPPNASLDEPPPPPIEAATISFNVGDVVLAKFSQDKQYYQAKVISKTGSSADPVYYVHFIGYPDKENKRSHEVRPVENKKRKNDGTPAAAAPPTRVPSIPVQNGAVISAAPSLEPPQPARHVPSLVSDGPTRMAPEPKKLKPNKKLEKAASSWQNFRKTGPKNPISGLSKQQLNRDSMFRTSDLPSAKGELSQSFSSNKVYFEFIMLTAFLFSWIHGLRQADAEGCPAYIMEAEEDRFLRDQWRLR
jgi:survival-of-motor-neuron-related-splicing factor 30